MHRNRFGMAIAFCGAVALSALLAAAWPQPPEGKIDPADPLLQSIQQRLGSLPRLMPEDSAGKPSADRYRAAELMLKSARLLDSDASDPECREIAKQLRKQVVAILQKD